MVTAEGLATAFQLDQACCGRCAEHMEQFVSRALSAKPSDRAALAQGFLAR